MCYIPSTVTNGYFSRRCINVQKSEWFCAPNAKSISKAIIPIPRALEIARTLNSSNGSSLIKFVIPFCVSSFPLGYQRRMPIAWCLSLSKLMKVRGGGQ